jgi:signal transduction histidine kinase
MPADSSNHTSNGQAVRSFADKTEPTAMSAGFGSWPLLIVGFGILIGLMIASGLAALNNATRLYTRLTILNQEYRRSLRNLDEIRSGIHISSVLIRDYLLDPSQSRAREIREELLKLRQETEQHLSLMQGSADVTVREMRKEIDAYWETLDPVFDWSQQDKQAAAYGFLRHRIIPRREAVLALAQELQTLNDATFQRQRQEVRRNEEQFRSFQMQTVAATVFLGILVAVVSILRVRLLERRSREQRTRTERAEDEMRRLSHQLVHAQEEERRSISRELHDEVGQMLTGLRMELRTLQKVYRNSPQEFDTRLEQSRVLLEQTLQAVRDIAMGLRPSMLDDLGLEAALQWQVRDFERRHEIAVTLKVLTHIDDLPERLRTNLYRIVQEALTNCARHARARNVTVGIEHDPSSGLRLWVDDDGVGMDDKPGTGLGLIGIQERVRELKGVFRVESNAGRGTRLEVEVPEEAVAHA